MLQKTISALLLLLISASAHANWVEDWFDTMNTTSSSSYQGQERGFATAGGFQARMRVKTDNLMTISPPRFNIGCGGIDIFMGGFSFLNADYMVDKFERIIRMAPALAFQVALNELSSTISEKVEGMEQIMNALNALQLDECQAAKGIVNFAADMYKSGPTEAIGAVAKNVETGVSNLFTSAKKDASDKPGETVKKSMNSLPATLKAELLKPGSMLKNIGDKFGLSTNEVNQFRALVGDVNIRLTDDDFSMAYEPGCSEATYEALVEETPYSKTLSGTCFESGGDNLEDKVSKILDSLENKIALNRSAPASANEAYFLGTVPYPIKYILNIANKYGSSQVTTVKDSLRTPAAYAFAYGIFSNMLYNLQDLLIEYQSMIKSAGKDNGITHGEALKELLKVVEMKQDEAYKAYAMNTNKMAKVYTLLQNYSDTDKMINEVLKRYGFHRRE
ncbi:MAG: conjugal transfer protein TraH [Deferribacterales bacterium]